MGRHRGHARVQGQHTAARAQPPAPRGLGACRPQQRLLCSDVVPGTVPEDAEGLAGLPLEARS